MRGAVVAALLAAGAHVPATAQTESLTMDGLGWGDCLAVLTEYQDAYTKRGGELLGEIEEDNLRSTAIALKKELIVLQCEKGFWSSEFRIDVEQL